MHATVKQNGSSRPRRKRTSPFSQKHGKIWKPSPIDCATLANPARCWPDLDSQATAYAFWPFAELWAMISSAPPDHRHPVPSPEEFVRRIPIAGNTADVAEDRRCGHEKAVQQTADDAPAQLLTIEHAGANVPRVRCVEANQHDALLLGHLFPSLNRKAVQCVCDSAGQALQRAVHRMARNDVVREEGKRFAPLGASEVGAHVGRLLHGRFSGLLFRSRNGSPFAP